MNQEQKIRSFIAVDIGQDVRTNLGQIQARLKRCGAEVKWVRPEGIHLTLRFLGNISEDEIGLAHQAMVEAAAGRPPFDVEIKGIGTFPEKRRPRVVWTGIEKGKENLTDLFQALEKSLVATGFPNADRPFKAHLTLGRIKSQRNVDKLIKSINSEELQIYGSFAVEKLTLFKSQLHPEGAIYSVLKQAPLSR
jgi:2'-5' RNA ligase